MNYLRCCRLLVALLMLISIAAPSVLARDLEGDHFRGQIVSIQDAAMVLKTGSGKLVTIGLPTNLTVLKLTRGSFAELEMGAYVGVVSYQLMDSGSIVRDSSVGLRRGLELRIIDEPLRGIALGQKKWDLTPASVIAHGWVDDIEDRVISIKWGPSDHDETDVEVPHDVPVNRMSLGDARLLKAGVHVLVGARKGPDGKYVASFVFCGKDGMVPPL